LPVTAGRSGSFRWLPSGTEAIGCLSGERPLEFDPTGRVIEPGGRCDVRTGSGRRGAPIDETSSFDPAYCADVVARDAVTGEEFHLSEAEATPRDPGSPPPQWVDIHRPACDEPSPDDIPYVNSEGADPTRAVHSEDMSLVTMPVPVGVRIWDVRSGQPLVTVAGGGALLGTSADGSLLFVRRERDDHLALITRRGARTRIEAGPAPDLACEPRPVAERAGIIALHLLSGVRLLDAATLAVRAEIAAEGACTMELAGERVLVRRGEEVLAFALDGTPAGTFTAPADFRSSGDGTALWRCENGVLETLDSATGAVRDRWQGACEHVSLAEDARWVMIRDVGRSRVRIIRLADGASLVLGMHQDREEAMRPFAFAPATGVFWSAEGTAHDLFAVRLGPRVLEDPLVVGEEAWARFYRATLLADFLEGRPLPTP
jgi:hypothetical protein